MNSTSLPIKIAPSILAGDFGRLADEAKRIEDSGADYLHIDIMDGLFVPNITMGPKAVSAINRSTELTLDVHLMIYSAYDYIERFVEAGADIITVHFEATEELEELLHYIRKCNVKAGIAFSPDTSLSMIPKYLDKCDQLVLMTVHPGFGGQNFIPDVLEKIQFARNLSKQLDIQVDGGINLETAALCIEAGANVLVSGSYLFNAPDMKQAVQTLRNIKIGG